MIKCVYKLEFSKSSFDLNEDYDRLSDYEKDIIAELDTESFFDYEENDKYSCYVITTPLELKKYSEVLINNLIVHEVINLSNNILNGDVNIESDTESKIDETNSFKYDFFIDDVNKWIFDNLEIDMVLDRINEVGINSLREIEKDFLKNYEI